MEVDTSVQSEVSLLQNKDLSIPEMSKCMETMETDSCCGNSEMDAYHKTDTIIPPKDLDELIQELRKVFASDKVNIDYVKTLMTLYKSNPKDWKQFAKFDPHRYTRNLVDLGNGKFNLMILCWNREQASMIHSHANSHCFMKILDGGVNEELFEWPENEEVKEMTPREKNAYEKDQTAYISDEIGLHRIENPSHTDYAVSLHLYSPPFDECKCFDQYTGHVTNAKVTFWSKFGKRTPFGKGQTK